jgi:hypothetical protein
MPLTPFANDIYDQLGAWRAADTSGDLSKLVTALAAMFDQIEEYARDQGERPGWAVIMDVDLCPVEALGFLAQFVGVSLRDGLTTAQQREWIRSTSGFRRGTPASMVGAAQQYMTGTKTVRMVERARGDAYHLAVITDPAETPDPAAVQRALISQKPAGIVLEYYTSAAPLLVEYTRDLHDVTVTIHSATLADVT